MAKTHRTYERSDKTDLEYYRGLARQLQKKVSSLEKENSRLSKLLRQEGDRLIDAEYEDEVADLPKKEKRWMCQECFHREYSEMVLPQGNILKVYRICKNCNKKDKHKCRENMDARGQQVPD